MALFRIDRTYRHFQRYQTIVSVLAKHGFGDLIDRLNLQRMLGTRQILQRLRPTDQTTAPLSFPARFRMALEELGPTFVKFGQILSTRPDLLPSEMILELSKLRERVPPIPFSEARRVIEQELERPLDEVFSEIDRTPLASASLAQAYRACLPEGQEVVVKVQRPRIEQVIRTDLSILANLASLAERTIQESRLYEPVRLVEEFAAGTLRELDFRLEGSNCDRMRAIFEEEPGTSTPEIHWDWTTRRILTMERVQGVRIDDRAGLLELGLDPGEIARRGAQGFMTQVLGHGFFHADPHPGNLFVREDGTIVMVDLGLVGHLDPEQSAGIAEILVDLVGRNYAKLVEDLRAVGFEIPEEIERPVRRDLRDLIEPLYGRALQELQLGDLLTRIVEITQRYQVRMPAEFLLLSRALVMIEGTGRLLDPELDLVELGRPMAVEILKRRYDPWKLAGDLARTAGDYRDLIHRLPRRLEALVDRLLRDRVRLEIQHRGLEDLQREIDRGTNRVALSVVVAGLLVGASIVLLAGTGDTLFGYPGLGVIGYLVGAVMGIWLIVGILRSGRL